MIGPIRCRSCVITKWLSLIFSLANFSRALSQGSVDFICVWPHSMLPTPRRMVVMVKESSHGSADLGMMS